MTSVCVDDDGKDWTATIDATSEQIDIDLLRCPEAPEGYEERFCALALSVLAMAGARLCNDFPSSTLPVTRQRR